MAERFISGSMFPDGPRKKVVTITDLSGGLNLLELDYRMDVGESPKMRNLWWRDGLLCCRDGQEYVSGAHTGQGICCYERLFHGHMIAHISDGLYAAVPGSAMTLTKLCDGLEPVRGTFIPYRDALLYKTRGAYKKIVWEEEALQAEDVEAYVPVTVINCTPEGSGDLYQPENRLSPKKTVWYTAARTMHSVSVRAETTKKVYSYQTANGDPVASVEQVYIDTTLQDAEDYTLSEDLCTVTFLNFPTNGSTVTVVYTVAVREYHLPVDQVERIDEVLVDGAAVTDYTADLEKGTVTFVTAPPMEDPPVNNTVKITYTKANPDAYNAVMDCCYGCAYGGTGSAVVILAGSTAQPNAYFWNGAHAAMDAGYFPIDYYNLAGDIHDAVTGFGQQAGYLMVFQKNGVGKCQLSSMTIDDRAYLALDYVPVSISVGCDLPWTIRTVENNLVWCNTYTGVCRLDDTNEALENQVRCISRKILGSVARPGLLQAVRDADHVCAMDDGEHYWLAADGEVYLWDYAISSSRKPSWFYFTDVPAVSFFCADCVPTAEDDGLAYTGARRIYHLDKEGRVSRFVRTFRDYGGAIDKFYRFAAQDFGDLERQKHISKIILATRSDTDTVLQLSYDTDQGRRQDRTPIRSHSWRLAPRNLDFRYLGVRRFAHVSVRRPGGRYVRYFTMELSNNEPGCDMSVVSAEIYADLVIKER